MHAQVSSLPLSHSHPWQGTPLRGGQAHPVKVAEGAGCFAGIPSQLAREPLAPSAWNPAPLGNSRPGPEGCQLGEGEPSARHTAREAAEALGGWRPRLLQQLISLLWNLPEGPCAAIPQTSLWCLSTRTKGTSLCGGGTPCKAPPELFPAIQGNLWPMPSDSQLSKPEARARGTHSCTGL